MTLRAPDETDAALVERLLAAIGGERIRSVRSFCREAVRIRQRGGAAPVVSLVRTWRAAGGSVRIDELGAGLGEDPDGAPDAQVLIAGASCDSRPASVRARGGERGGEEVRAEVLREVALEPRNLLAHLGERRAAIRARPGGAIEIELPEEGVIHRFDAGSGLCVERIEQARGIRVEYLDWRAVDGILTPFHEIREEAGGVTEERVLGVAYDLPFDPALFGERGA